VEEEEEKEEEKKEEEEERAAWCTNSYNIYTCVLGTTTSPERLL